MADDVTLDAGSGGDVIAADDISGVKHQRVKVQHGADGAATDVSTASPLPVGDAGGSLTVDNDGTFVVQAGATQVGTWTVQPGNTANTTAWKVDGSAVTQPVSGALTNTVLSVVGTGTEAAAQRVTIATDSTGVLSVDDNGSTLSVDDGAGSLTVDNATIAVVGSGTEATAQRVTIATDSTGVLSVDDNGGSLTVDGTVAVTGVATDAKLDTIVTALGTANTSLAIIDNVVYGAGTEAAAQRVTIATDSTGVLSVDDNGGSLTVDGTITEANSAACAASLSVLDDWDESDRAKVNLIAGQAGIAAGTGVDGATVPRVSLATNVALPTGANVIGAVTQSGTFTTTPATTGSGTATGAARVELANNGTGVLATVGAVTAITNALPAGTNAIGKLAANSGVDIGDVDVTTVGTITPGTAASSLGKAEDAAHASGDVGVMGLAVRQDTAAALATTDGDYIPLTTNSTGRLYVEPAGNIAHDGADSGNPVKVGAKARTADITAVAAADRTDLASDTQGHILTRPYALHEKLVSAGTAAITDTTSTQVLAAVASNRTYVTSLLVTNSHATVGTLVSITDGSGGTVLYAGYAAAVGGGFSCTFPTPLRTSSATALHAVCGTTGSNVYVSASGYSSTV